MKKIIVFILCVMLLMALPVVASAEEVDTNVSTTEEIVTEVEIEPTITEAIVDYVKTHIEEISVIVALIVSAFYDKIVRGRLSGSIGTLNNNAISIAENSAKAIKDSLSEVEDIANVVKSYKEEFATLLKEVRKSAEEKQSLEDMLAHVENFLKSAKLATLELSNEVAELLVLANIPNSVKEELTARHLKAVHELEKVDEVISNDGTEA
jgi:hypothetical protein